MAAYNEACAARQPASKDLYQRYNSIVGSIRHCVPVRGDVSAAMDLLGRCLTFATEKLYECARRVLVYLGRTRLLGPTYCKNAPRAAELYALCDANWTTTRSVSGGCFMLGGSAVSTFYRSQHCITMSSTEAELYALAECAIELLYFIGLLEFIGHKIDGAVSVGTDNKGAYDLCHRFTSAQNSRHIDRRLFKMRELRGLGVVSVRWVPTDDNFADIFTKVLSRQPFEKHRRSIFNSDAGVVVEDARKRRVRDAEA